MALKDRSPVEWLPSTITTDTLRWGIPLLGASIIYATYLVTHSYPAYGAGLYLETIAQIVANGYALPPRIPGYTAEGIPFAYPPLAFYTVALLTDRGGFDPITVARFLPGLLVIAYLLPYHYIASELTSSSRQAMLATVLFATSPTVLRWHLSAGGIVRAMALLFALTSIYAGIRLFRTHALHWLAIGTVTFALVVLTHPTYTVFVVLSYLLVYVAYDRSLRGLISGAFVGFGGIVLAAPWWLQVTAIHGIDVFFAASGTHGGLGTGLFGLLDQLTYPFDLIGVHIPYLGLVYVGVLYSLWKRRWFLPAWLLAAAFVLGKNRFVFVPGSLIAAAFVYEVIVPVVRDRIPVFSSNARQSLSMVVIGLVAISAVTGGALYAAGMGYGVHADRQTQPQFVHEDDVAAMQWAEVNTPPDATFVVLGDTAEWMPFIANRTILIGPWGVEWKDTDEYYAQVHHLQSISSCRDEQCLSRSLDRAGVSPDYVYVPKGDFTTRGQPHTQDPIMAESLRSSPDFEVVFENEEVVIAAVNDESRDGTNAER